MTSSVPNATYFDYAGDGVTVAFSFPLRFLEDGDLRISLIDADDVETVQTISTHYSVGGAGAPSGGTVTFVTAPPPGVTVRLARRTNPKQTIDFTDSNRVPGDTLEAQLDRFAMIAQDLYRELERAPKVPYGVDAPDISVGASGTVPQWDADGNLIQGPTATQIAAAQGYAEAAQEAASDAQAGLGRPFDNITAAQAYAPVTAPNFIELAGYASAGDGGGALYKKVTSEPSHAGKFSITLADAVTVVWYEIVTITNVFQFGVTESADPADNTTAITALEGAASGVWIDLLGKTIPVTSYPTGNTYVNGFFDVSGAAYDAAQDKAALSSATDTGVGFGAPYAGGILNYVQVSGRTTDHLFGNILSQRCRAYGPSRAGNLLSIYSEAKGNISGNVVARQCGAYVPQSINIASEECWVWGGVRGANVASAFSGCENESNANLAARYSHASGRNSVNIASTDAYAGRGGGAKLTPVVAAGVITSVTVDLPGVDYLVGDTLAFFDRLSATATGAAATVASINGSGGITGITVSAGGTGYSGTGSVDAAIDNGTGDFSANIATTNTCKTSGIASANMAATGSTASGRRSLNAASESCVASADHSANIASETSTASGDLSANIASIASISSGTLSASIAAQICEATNSGSVVFGRRTINNQVRSIAIGDNGAGIASTANRKFHALPNGNVQASGTFTGSTVFTDYAEYFENFEIGTIPLGVLVTLNGRQVRPTQPGDDILGVVSATALVVAGDSPFQWSGRHLTGEFGELLYEDVECVDWSGTNGIESYSGTVAYALTLFDAIPEHAVYSTERHPIENPDYDPTIENVPRSQRPEEWTCVGLLGQVHVRVDQSVLVGGYVAGGADGVGTASAEGTNMRCMEIRRPYDDDKGYAVAFCLIR